MKSRIVATVSIAAAVVAMAAGGPALGQDLDLFVTAERCVACHNVLVAPTGEDISIGSDWRSSMMANSARDPYWQAGVRRAASGSSNADGCV